MAQTLPAMAASELAAQGEEPDNRAVDDAIPRFSVLGWKPVVFVREGAAWVAAHCGKRPTQRRRDAERGIAHRLRSRNANPAPPAETSSSTAREEVESCAAEAVEACRPPSQGVDPVQIYLDCELRLQLARLEDHRVLTTALSLVVRDTVPGGTNICFPQPALVQRMTLAAACLPTDAVRLRALVETATERRGLSTNWDEVARDLALAHGRRVRDWSKPYNEGCRVVRY
ncbi:uncharacterized protein LOC134527757 [Bacillus rossius redtenbacheri]|uniref:uncharacterized protein LOC134527757 n=1 Tax=Bacillus rossius redtenbacheri TaxID=93214 RepID=UPI002FDD4EA9